MLSIGSLFSGCGGLERGLELAGLGPVVWQCEIDPFCRAVLEKHWPGVPKYEDIRALDPATLPRVDLLCGGFPCQDVSDASPIRPLGGVRTHRRRRARPVRRRRERRRGGRVQVAVSRSARLAPAWIPNARPTD
jgi:site-specific DNA-cytosine methylase